MCLSQPICPFLLFHSLASTQHPAQKPTQQQPSMAHLNHKFYQFHLKHTKKNKTGCSQLVPPTVLLTAPQPTPAGPAGQLSHP